MSSLVQPVIDGLNGVGNALSGSAAAALAINHFVASRAVHVVTLVLSTLQAIVAGVLEATMVALEDFGTFAWEVWQIGVKCGETTFSVVDGFFQSLYWLASSIVAAVLTIFYGVGHAFTSVTSLVAHCFVSLADCFTLLGSSVLLLLQLVPRTIHLTFLGSKALAKNTALAAIDGAASVSSALAANPLEMLTGVLVAAALAWSFSRLARRWASSPSDMAHAFLGSLLLLQLVAIRAAVIGLRALSGSLRCVLRVLAAVLTHLHVPRFHQAGDSDGEDESEDHGLLVGQYDSSDAEEREQRAAKRRNFELLMRRAQERRHRGESGQYEDDDEDDVESRLYHQVELEREDKLCVICVDKEKCIMMLPCRHLCMCQECVGAWLRAAEEAGLAKRCPMCRKVVRQTIKAYL